MPNMQVAMQGAGLEVSWVVQKSESGGVRKVPSANGSKASISLG